MGLTRVCRAQLGTILPSLPLRDRLLTARVVPGERATTDVTTVQLRVEAATMRGHLGRTAVCHPADGVVNCARLVPSSRLPLLSSSPSVPAPSPSGILKLPPSPPTPERHLPWLISARDA